jgi:hypothetical protein
MEIWSTLFLSDEHAAAEWATAAVDMAAWRRLQDEHEGARRLIGRFEWAEKEWYVALGAPVYEGDAGGSGNRLFLPVWMLPNIGIEGCGEVLDVEWMSQEAFPEATKIVLRPHDSAFYHADAKEELETALTRLGVVIAGATIQVPLQKLGGYEVLFDVVSCEPANVVLAEGDEVAIEFEQAVDAAAMEAAARAQAEAEAAEASATSETDFNTLVHPDSVGAMAAPGPATWTAAGAGQRLGGGAPRVCADGRRWNPWRDGQSPST